MGLCCRTHDIKPDAFFMVDCYRYHDKYTLSEKDKEWFGFAFVDVKKVAEEF